MAATEEFGLILQELDNLHEQDKYGVFGGQATMTAENLSLKNANDLILKIKNAKISDKSSETSSVLSRHSHRSKLSHASTSSSVARLRAAAEAAAAKEQAEHERLIAEKEHKMKQREAEEEKRRQQARAQHEKDIAIMSANKRVAIANAKLRAIQESLAEEGRYESPDFPDMDTTECLERTIAWVRSNSPILEDNPHFRPIHTSKDRDPL